jgi:hypothetical protein
MVHVTSPDRGYWWAQQARRVFGSVILVIAAWVLYKTWQVPRERLWSADNIDFVVAVTLSAVIAILMMAIIVSLISRRLLKLDVVRDHLVPLGGVALLVVTLYVAYATFRNQTRLVAEADLNVEAMALYDIEMNRPELRCLYYNYRIEDATSCLEHIISNPMTWSLSIFYVEESWFILTKASRDREEWGSTYAASIRYWADDVALDPTGMFSYYLVSSEDSLQDASEILRVSQVRMTPRQLCLNYDRVWQALARRRLQPARVRWCPQRRDP